MSGIRLKGQGRLSPKEKDTGFILRVSSVDEPGQVRGVAQSYLTLCDPMDCSTPGLPVLHQLPELTQTHVH